MRAAIAISKPRSLLRILILLTGLAVFAQIIFLRVNSLIGGLIDDMISASLTQQVFHSPIVILAFAKFICAQLLVYIIYISLIWSVATGIGELCSLRERYTYTLGIFLWFVSAIAILSANTYYVPHSFFAFLIRTTIFQDQLTNAELKFALIITTSLLILAIVLATLNLFYRIHKKNIHHHNAALFSVLGIGLLLSFNSLTAHKTIESRGSEARPNIIIIGLDAVRSDFLGNVNPAIHTPFINHFLGTSIQFSKAYTTLARTFPAWASILTGTYPLHNGARGNNTDLNLIQLNDTLPKHFQEAGYETIYGTDDTRFNNTNALFGFDQMITPPMGINDFLIGSINDFPLTNLLIPTPIGRLLFPYNYANHGTAITYDPDNFLQLFQNKLAKHPKQPLFLAVHFTMTHWPFYWFNDKQPVEQRELLRYQAGIEGIDTQIAKFFKLLEANKLLDHAVVVLLSDHGIALGLPGDKIITNRHYQGNKINLKKMPIAKYSKAPLYSLDLKHDFGIDTGYGYGSDVLSLSAYRILLAFKSYGLNIGPAHRVTAPVSLVDIAPTLLQAAHLPPLQQADGISLTPYLADARAPGKSRPLYLETTYSIDEIEKEGISVKLVLEKTLQLYYLEPHTGLIFINPHAEKLMNQNKQLAVLQDNWLFMRYPPSERAKINMHGYQTYLLPAFMVLVNLKTGQWTTELNTPFAQSAPLAALRQDLYAFYGKY